MLTTGKCYKFCVSPSCILQPTTLSYQPLPALVSRVKEVQHQYRLLSKQHERVKRKIALAAEEASVTVNEELHNDLVTIASASSTFLDQLPADSFQRIFWRQQVDAAALKNARTMRWHPVMIRWCLQLRHQ